jgi:hypothetical protein
MGHLLEMEVLMETIFWTSSILVGGFKHFLFFHILEIIIPTDELIFFRGVETTNQIYSSSLFFPRLWFWVYVYVDPQSSEFPGTMHQIIQEVKPRKGKIHTKGLLRIMLRPRFLWQRTRVWETHTFCYQCDINVISMAVKTFGIWNNLQCDLVKDIKAQSTFRTWQLEIPPHKWRFDKTIIYQLIQLPYFLRTSYAHYDWSIHPLCCLKSWTHGEFLGFSGFLDARSVVRNNKESLGSSFQ